MTFNQTDLNEDILFNKDYINTCKSGQERI